MHLRKVTNQETRNFDLGGEYATVTEKYNPEQFEQFLEEGDFINKERIYGFVYAPDVKPIPLYDYHKNYLMNPNGKNFTNISCDYKRPKSEKSEKLVRFSVYGANELSILDCLADMRIHKLEEDKKVGSEAELEVLKRWRYQIKNI